MTSKGFLLLGLLVANFLLINSEVAAEISNDDDEKNVELAEKATGIDDAKHGGYGGYPGGGGYGGHPGRGGYGGGYCRYGCCGRGYYGRGCRCCSYGGEAAAVDAQTEAKPHN